SAARAWDTFAMTGGSLNAGSGRASPMSELNPFNEPDDPKLRQILDAASDLPAGQRVAFLVQACGGDTALRERVESLLRDLERAGDFLANPTAEHPAAAAETV